VDRQTTSLSKDSNQGLRLMCREDSYGNDPMQGYDSNVILMFTSERR
jgi:hypothetical protein